MKHLALKSRLKASSIHFLLSLIVVAVAVVGSAMLWYPGQLAFAAGLVTMMTILMAVDLVLGPLLTMFVYQPGKKSLVFDLAVIAAVQLAALGYGLHTVYQARPVYVVFAVDRFETVAAADLEAVSLDDARPEYRELSRTGPRWVAVRLPDDPERLQQLTLAEAIHGTGPALLPALYDTLESVVPAALGKAQPLAELRRFNADHRVDEVVAKLGGDVSQLRYFPLKSVDEDLSVIVDAGSGAVIDIVHLKPWG